MAATLPGQVEVSPGEEDDDQSYTDILVIGKTGMGKSTLANKLLGINPDTKKPVKPDDVIMKWDHGEEEISLHFETGEGIETITKKCKVLSNEKTKNRVLDAQPFTDVEMAQKMGVARGNYHCLRLILQKHREHKLHFTRVVYFMPNRGPPERVEGTLQEEIKAMYGYFGQKIFNLMVIAVTNQKRAQEEFLVEDLRATMNIFMTAFEGITEARLPKCPPIIYVPIASDPEKLLDDIIGAEVISDAENLTFSPQYPIDQSIYGTESEKTDKGPDKRHCRKCSAVVVFDKNESSESSPSFVELENGETEPYESSKCHPEFVPRHSCTTKCVGGLGHVLTLGISLIFPGSWPGFTNSEIKCVQCGLSPMSPGCYPIKQTVTIDAEVYEVEHDLI